MNVNWRQWRTQLTELFQPLFQNGWRDFLNRLIHPAPKQPGLCCLYITPMHIYLSYAIYDAQKMCQIQFLESVSYTEKELEFTLKTLYEKYQLKDVSCSWILHSQFYQLVFLDKPKVHDDELNSALRWKIKDFIDFSPEDALIDSLKIDTADSERLYAVAASQTKLKFMVQQIESAGFTLEYIDIPELAFRNLLSFFQIKDHYCGLLILDNDQASLIVTHNDDLLLSQKINVPITFDLANPSPNFLLEIQNGFVYCKQQLKASIPRLLFITSTNEAAANALQELLGFDVILLTLNGKMEGAFLFNNTYLEKSNLIVLGGVCRENNHAAN